MYIHNCHLFTLTHTKILCLYFSFWFGNLVWLAIKLKKLLFSAVEVAMQWSIILKPATNLLSFLNVWISSWFHCWKLYENRDTQIAETASVAWSTAPESTWTLEMMLVFQKKSFFPNTFNLKSRVSVLSSPRMGNNSICEMKRANCRLFYFNDFCSCAT